VTSGTPPFPFAAEYEAFRDSRFVHRVSPGTVSYCDDTALRQLDEVPGYAPAAFVISRVISRPSATIVTCDAGHKTLSVDRGVPHCRVIGYEDEIVPLSPSEEHLPLDVSRCASPPRPGDLIQLLPTHVCPTINNFDDVIVLRAGKPHMERVEARGREAPLRAAGCQVPATGFQTITRT
jgi:D-serine deaminase-like pyridoxal phosphate-dependent protein